jgi:plasmid maintenance system antidote protein VapI
MATRKKIKPLYPGEILNEEFLAPLGITQYRVAKETSVPPRPPSQSVVISARQSQLFRSSRSSILYA